MYLRQGYLSKLMDQGARLQLARPQLALDESTLAADRKSAESRRAGIRQRQYPHRQAWPRLDGARDLAGSPIAANGAIERPMASRRPDYAPTWWVCGEGDHRRRRKW